MDYLELKDHKFYKFDDYVRVIFKKYYYFDISNEEMSDFDEYDIDKNSIGFENYDKVIKRFYNLLDQKLRNELYHVFNKKQTIFIDRESNVPLIGTNEFGIVDRNTSILEIKPLTGCNYSCVFCSVDEGNNKKSYDYLVDHEYLIDEIASVVRMKKNPVEINIGPQGEPLMYPDIIELIEGLMKIPNVYFVSMNSNGSLLTKDLVDKLADAKLGRLNLSMDAVDDELAKKLASATANVKRIIEMANYAKDKFQVMPAPVIMQGLNDHQADDLIKLALSLKKEHPFIGFQNFLEYKGGRKPVKAISMDDFYDWLKPYEEKYDIKLRLYPQDFNIYEDKTIEKPFKKNAKIKARIVCPGRKRGEVIASAEGRAITVRKCHITSGNVKIKLIRDKHNIYSGFLL